MASIQDVAVLVFSVARGCSKILETLLCFLGEPSPRSPAVDEAVAFLVVVIPMSCLAGVAVAYFSGVVLDYLHLAAAAPATAMSFADVVRFVVLLCTLVSLWLLATVSLAFIFVFLIAGKLGIPLGFSWNVLS